LFQTINDNLNPRFVKTFKLSYCFQEHQPLLFEVYDIDDFTHQNDLARQDFIGQFKVCTGAPLLPVWWLVSSPSYNNTK